ncbi:MAG: hypothetical protein DWP94_00730 [Flavobacterium sp.]|nr:MAG: hypothetical protein DWP94_00730 [Flavobacterium sp.]
MGKTIILCLSFLLFISNIQGQTFENLWNVLKTNNEPLDDSALAKLLSEMVHESVANIQLEWNN